MSTNDIFYLTVIVNALLGVGTQLLLALAIVRFTNKSPAKREQDQ